MSNSKPLSIEEILNGLQIAANKGNNFAASLLNGHKKYNNFTPKQFTYALQIARNSLSPTATSQIVSVQVDASKIEEMFRQAQENKIKYPKVNLTDGKGNGIKFQLAGPNSKYAGKIMVTDGLPFGQNKWYGVISSGVFEPSKNYSNDQEIISQVKEFAENPAATAKAYGIRMGNCCFCGRSLIETVSVDVGYGPICADKYGLPH